MRYRTICVDPPWAYNDKLRSGNSGFGIARLTRGAANHYAVMPMEQIAALPTGDWAEPDAHLYVWTTNTFMCEAHDLARGWGFEPKTILTWVKPQPGMGWYYRNNTEHVVFAVRGSLGTLRSDCPTAFSAPRLGHSEKPAAFYDMVESMSPGPYLDVFARKNRFGWDAFGNECWTAPHLRYALPDGGKAMYEQERAAVLRARAEEA